MKPPTVTVSIQRLEKNGLLIRRQDEKDLRVSRIYLSDAGNAIIKEGMQLAREGEKQILRWLLRKRALSDAKILSAD